MKKLALLCMLFASGFGMMRAVVVQKFCMKNGSVYYGFIVKQNTEGNMTISADRSLISVPGKQVKILREYSQSESELSQAWVAWARTNHAFFTENGVKKLRLADVSVTDSTSTSQYRGVCLTEKGYHVTFLSMQPVTHTIRWDDVSAIQSDRRSVLELSGINVRYDLANGSSIEGQYAEETASSLSLFDAQGVKHTFAIDDVVKMRSSAINPQQDFFQQCPTLDHVKLRSGETIEGYIVEQVFDGDKSSLTVKTKEGALRMVKMNEVVENQRVENTDGYKPIMDFIVEKGQIFLNRQLATYKAMTEVDNVVSIAQDSLKKVCLKMPLSKKDVELIFECNDEHFSTLPELQLINLTQTEGRKATIYQFTYKNLATQAIRPEKSECSVNGTRKLIYRIPSAGTYALFNAKNRKAFFVEVK